MIYSRAGAGVVIAVVLVAATSSWAPSWAWPGWSRIAEDANARGRRERYRLALEQGDELVLQASEESLAAERRRLIERAKASYLTAIAAQPSMAEPHLRLAKMLLAFFVDCESPTLLCNPRQVNKALTQEALTHLDAFEAAAPLDPRATELLDDRAILATKLGDFAKAILYYERLLERLAIHETSRRNLAEGNLAETYMMTGRVEEAITTYRQAAASSGRASLVYGLAVALDRGGRSAQAREAIVALGATGLVSFEADLASGDIFYVPAGESSYYLGLANEALGNTAAAIVHYERFIRSGAHPQFQPRARQHRDRLAKRKAP